MSPSSKAPGADPDFVAALRLVEQLEPALARRDRAKLEHIIRQLVALRAPMGGQWQALAQIAVNIGEMRLSRAAIELFVEASGGSDAARYQKAAFLAQGGALQEAYDLLCSLPDTVPDPAANAYSRGTTLLNFGRAEEAREQLERVTRMRPKSGSAWLALALSADLAREPDLADRIVAAGPGMASALPSERAAYRYAVGKAHAERGEHALAFAAFAEGARQQRAMAAYDRVADRLNAEEAVRGYSSERIAAVAGRQRERTGRTIFVAGLPRSGTTLVEQILTSHSAVGDGAEINRLELLAGDVGGQGFAALDRYVGAHGIEQAAQLWHHWLGERFPSPGRVVDKTVNTGRYLGLAAALLPEAPLVWVTRDPLDRAWSCFRTYFLAGMPWSYDLEDIGFHFRLHDGLLRRWREILGDRLLVVPYEALVTDPERWIGRILSHCGLPAEPQAFAPHENRRPVITASVTQVRRPITTAGIGSAEPYREFLGPFLEACREVWDPPADPL